MDLIFRESELSDDIVRLIAEIPEFQDTPGEKILSKTSHGYLLVVAEHLGRIVGFKLGYPINEGIFYSWIGGTLPDFRRQGIARSLIRLQERLALERGFSAVRVKSMNQFPGMLHLLISEYYQIVAVETHSGKIVFEKSIGVFRDAT